MSPPLHNSIPDRELAESCDSPLTVSRLAQIQSDEHVHLDLLGQTLDGHDLDLLRIGETMQSSAANEKKLQGIMQL